MEELKALPDNMLNLDDEIDEVYRQARLSSAVADNGAAIPVRTQPVHYNGCGRKDLDCGEQCQKRAHKDSR